MSVRIAHRPYAYGQGAAVRAKLDKRKCPLGVTAPKAVMASLALRAHDLRGDWDTSCALRAHDFRGDWDTSCAPGTRS